MRWAVFDELITRATQDEGDVRLAREVWGQKTGHVHADHELYSERSDAFVEWYLLEHCSTDGTTALDRILATLPADSSERSTYVSLRSSHRSLFCVRSVSNHSNTVRVDDVIGGAQFEVDERRNLPGIQPGDLFETRLCPDPERPYRLVFSRAMLFHPRGAESAVLKHVDDSVRRHEAREQLLARLLRLRLRCLAYKHVSPLRIYSQKDAPA